MEKKILIDSVTGVCPGVKYSVQEALKAGDSDKKAVTYGPLIHNPVIAGQLKEAGIGIIDSLSLAPEDQLVIIRAHGVPPEDEALLKKREIPYLDLTCKIVKSVHKKIAAMAAEGRQIIIVGSPKHPETIGHMGYAGAGGVVLASEEEAAAFTPADKSALFAQTTTSGPLFDKIEEILKKKNPLLKVENTICGFVKKRQSWIKKAAARADAALIIGGKNSSNTKKLYQLAAENTRAIQIEDENELSPEELKPFKCIALTAGTSTPEETINRVLEKLKKEGYTIERV